jgi:glutamate racemase
VLATVATLSGEKLHKLIDRHAGSVRIITQPCPGLPERVEAGDLDGPQTRTLVERYTAPLLAGGADVIVLGSTHYPFLRPLIQSVVGPMVSLLDTGEAVARRVESMLTANGEDLRTEREGAGAVEWFSSGTVQHMESTGARLWGMPIVAKSLGA